MNWELFFGIINYIWNFGITLGTILIIKKLDTMEKRNTSKEKKKKNKGFPYKSKIKNANTK